MSPSPEDPATSGVTAGVSPEESMMPRELIEPNKGDKRYVRRSKGGQFKASDDVGRSLAADRRTKATTVVKKGEGDRGDQKRKKQSVAK
jgi:hypothetical protein